jgi:hypothetical protein
MAVLYSNSAWNGRWKVVGLEWTTTLVIASPPKAGVAIYIDCVVASLLAMTEEAGLLALLENVFLTELAMTKAASTLSDVRCLTTDVPLVTHHSSPVTPLTFILYPLSFQT